MLGEVLILIDEIAVGAIVYSSFVDEALLGKFFNNIERVETLVAGAAVASFLQLVEDEDLTKQWKQIKDTYSRISALEVVKSTIDLTMILEILGIIAAVVLIVTMISAKVKAAKLTRPPKEPKKPKKKEEELPSI